ncbi:MAG TPA: GNAT family N-acetyltransferase [Steroidobacteraceae bacterium]
MKFVECTAERHSAAILEIFNEAIANSTAIYEYELLKPDYMVKWFDTKARGNYPVIGLETDAGELAGFASFGKFRDRPAYKYTIEHSVYVETRFRGQKLGSRLLEAVMEAAVKQNYHVMMGGIDAANAVSIRLHERFGFTYCGTVAQAGFKFGRWLDLAFYQRVLSGPLAPVEG